MTPEHTAEARAGHRTLRAETVSQLILAALQLDLAVSLVGHCVNKGDLGFSALARRYAASEAAGRPASASRRERTSQALQSAGSSPVARRAASTASVVFGGRGAN